MKKKILSVSCLIVLLLTTARAFALEDTSRTDILGAKVNALEKKSRESDEKIKTVESKITQLESRVNTSDSKMGYLLRLNTQLESQVSDLEAAQTEMKKSGKKVKKTTAPQAPKGII